VVQFLGFFLLPRTGNGIDGIFVTMPGELTGTPREPGPNDFLIKNSLVREHTAYS
jgi:hypothetical protein